MTKAELNNQVKQFVKRIKEGKIDPHGTEAKLLYNTLHGADNTLKSFTAESLRAMIVLNRLYSYISWHTFGPDDL